MKKVLWIACLLLVMPFLGYSQKHAGLAEQDFKALFGPAPVSNPLPKHVQLNGIDQTRDGNNIFGHVMFIPSSGHHYGYYYAIYKDGTIQTVRRYDGYYLTSAEYYKPYPATESIDQDFPVWSYSDDLKKGFHRLRFDNGTDNTTEGDQIPATNSIRELTYDYLHNAAGREGRMLGTEYGYIYEVNLNWGTTQIGTLSSDTLYDYNDHEGLYPLAMACDLTGTLYFINLSEDGTTSSKLYYYAADDVDSDGKFVGEPHEVGELGWAAQYVQTMAFDHQNGDKLYWWQCDKDGKTNLVEIILTKNEDGEPTGCTTELVADMGHTQMGGLIFEFIYKPYTAYCISSDKGQIRLKNGSNYNLEQNDYKPAKQVDFKVTVPNNSCYTLKNVYVLNHANHADTLFTIPASKLISGKGSFNMPACDVDIVADYEGNVNDITLQWNPTTLVDALTIGGSSEATTAQCGDVVTVTYAHPTNYFLKTITVTTGTTPVNFDVNMTNSTITFTMPNGPVVVNALYLHCSLENVADVCLHNGLAKPINGGHSLDAVHGHKWTFTAPNGTTFNFGPFTNTQSNNFFKNTLIFDNTFFTTLTNAQIVGQWHYTGCFTSSTYGDFPLDTKTFNVINAPESIAINDHIEIETGVYYNAHHNCDGDSIHLEVIATPADYVFNGTFEWQKQNAAGVYETIATTTEPLYVILPCNMADGGLYQVIYTPNVTSAEGAAAEAAPCEFPLDEPFEVNVASIPNIPIVESGFGGTEDNVHEICYQTSDSLVWRYGVLKPWEYDRQWYTVDADGVWTEIPGATDIYYVTGNLTEDTQYGLSINYAKDEEHGEYFLCHRESDVFTVIVHPNVELEVEGARETCKGMNPDPVDNPTVVNTGYNRFEWWFNHQLLAETSETLHFENAANGQLVNEPGLFWVEVYGYSDSECPAYAKFQFEVKDLPQLYMTNNQTEDTCWADDNPITEITVCAGTRVKLYAHNGTDYIWGEGLDAVHGDFIVFTAEETTEKQFKGVDEESGCENTVKIKVNVNPRPEVAWVLPLNDTTFSMITDEYQLVATPAGGQFTYIIPGAPDVDYPIDGGILRPSELGIGTYQLVYVYTDANGCSSERRIRNITIEKPYWTDIDKWDPNWMYNCEHFLAPHRYEITSPAQMGSFMAYVYGLNGVTQRDFEGDTIWIMNDIDLQEKPYFYRPFFEGAPFKGVIDGTGKIISNMTILEDDLVMRVDGFIRNVGVKDAKVTSVGNPCVVDVQAEARLHNSYITMPELNNVVPQLMPFGDTPILPTGEVRNVYYYGIIPGIPETIPGSTLPYAVYMESTETPQVQTTLDGITSKKLYNPANGKGILEEWVWLQNDYYYNEWQNAYNDVNYGYPYHNGQFMHHHYITVNVCDEAQLVSLAGDAKQRTLQYHPEIGSTLDYAMNGETVTVNLEPNQYVIVDSLVCTAAGYNGVFDSVWVVKGPATSFDVLMPVDSMPFPAYDLTIETYCRRDYWIDEGNYNPNWYTNCISTLPNGRFEIKSNRDLAAFAHAVMVDGIDFEGCLVVIDGSENSADPCLGSILDMTGHFWMPISGFKGIFDGKTYIVDNLYIREELNAMFVNMNGGIIRNLGVQDIDLPKDEDAAVAAFVYNNAPDYAGTVLNSFAVNDPATHVTYPMVSAYNTIENCYTLSATGIETNENGVGTDIGQLQNWVHTQTESGIYFDWVPDECVINYSHPVHEGLYDGGYAITYDPSDDDYLDDPTLGGSVHGPQAGKTGQLIQVDPKPQWPCNNCNALWVTDNDGNPLTDDEGNDISDILSTMEFIMPDYPVTVHATFVPVEWNLTIDYIVDDDPDYEIASYTGTAHYEDEVIVPRPVLADYEPYDMVDGEMVFGKTTDTIVMPCGHKNVEVHYIGKQHGITFCEEMEIVATATTNHEDNIFRYHETVTVTVVAKEGYSIPTDRITITGADGNPIALSSVNFSGSNGHYTFTMPNTDIELCFGFTEEFWDDWRIGDISWFVGNEDADVYTLTTDSMLGGLAALVSGREWLFDPAYEWDYEDLGPQYTEDEVAGFDFAGKTIIVSSEQEEGMIDLIEHKWRPIGAQILYTKYFQGYFDGQNTVIVNMKTADFTEYDEPGNGSCQAFFGNVGDDAVVINLNISGHATGRYFTAGVAGVNYGKIVNCVANVVVRSEFEAGGIVGNNFGLLLNSYCTADTIDCMSAMPLGKSTNNYYVGGVAAYNAGEIKNCHSVAFLYRSGTLANNPTNWFGGVVGMNEGLVENCYWTVNPVEDGVGGGNALVNSNVLAANTWQAMNTTALALADEYPFDFNGWKQDTEAGYPVFDLNRMIMSNNEHDINVDLYPNPTKGLVNIFSENIQRVSVYNMFGQLVLDTEVNANQTTINMSTFSAGVYMVRIATAEGVTTRNVIVE